jgi:hypothetical protein
VTQLIPTERVTLLFPLRVPGGEIREVVMRPIDDNGLAAMRADEIGYDVLEIVARAAGLPAVMGKSIADADLMRLAHASDRCRMRFCAQRDAAA